MCTAVPVPMYMYRYPSKFIVHVCYTFFVTTLYIVVLVISVPIVPKRETGDPVSASCILIVVSLVPVANTTPRPS